MTLPYIWKGGVILLYLSWQTMHTLSPLRYPGGKAAFAPFLEKVIELNGLKKGRYVEPYAGGAGAALTLLNNDVVSEIAINDADRRIYAFWKSILYEADRFIDAILEVPLTIDEWYRQRDKCASPETAGDFELGFAAFYMNRCNRSGTLSGAGPIGGYAQSGKWRLDVRFNRQGLAERVARIANKRDRITISNQDAIDFLSGILQDRLSHQLLYLDPPYVKNGRRLYLNHYDSKSHMDVARYIQGLKGVPWVVSYDDADLIRSLYKNSQIFSFPTRYTFQRKGMATELLIAPESIKLPADIELDQATVLSS